MPDIGDPAPLFTGTDIISGQPFSLSQHQGDVLAVFFSGLTWCPPCQYELPILQELWEEFQLMLFPYFPNVQFVIITSGDDDTNLLTSMLQQNGITIPVLSDDPDYEIKQLYDIWGVPTTYFIDKDLKICGKKIGTTGTENGLKNAIRAHIQGCGAQSSLLGSWDHHWVAVAEILSGIIPRPLPDPPPELDMSPEKRDLLTGLAISELARNLSDPKVGKDLEIRSLRAAEAGLKKLLKNATRPSVSFENNLMPDRRSQKKKR